MQVSHRPSVAHTQTDASFSKPPLQHQQTSSRWSIDSDDRGYSNRGCLNLRSNFSLASLKPLGAKARALFSRSEKQGDAQGAEKPQPKKLQKQPPEQRQQPTNSAAEAQVPRLQSVTNRGELRPELRRHPLENPRQPPKVSPGRISSPFNPRPLPASFGKQAQAPGIPARNPWRDPQAFENPRPAPAPPPGSNNVNDPRAFVNPRKAPQPPGRASQSAATLQPPARNPLRDAQFSAATDGMDHELRALFDEVMMANYGLEPI